MKASCWLQWLVLLLIVSTTDFESNEFMERTIIKHFVSRNVDFLFTGMINALGEVITKK